MPSGIVSYYNEVGRCSASTISGFQCWNSSLSHSHFCGLHITPIQSQRCRLFTSTGNRCNKVLCHVGSNLPGANENGFICVCKNHIDKLFYKSYNILTNNNLQLDRDVIVDFISKRVKFSNNIITHFTYNHFYTFKLLQYVLYSLNLPPQDYILDILPPELDTIPTTNSSSSNPTNDINIFNISSCNDMSNIECSICLEEKNPISCIQLGCSHRFCSVCILRVTNRICPMCRSPF